MLCDVYLVCGSPCYVYSISYSVWAARDEDREDIVILSRESGAGCGHTLAKLNSMSSKLIKACMWSNTGQCEVYTLS